jgi:8-oxo-dGTP pyrophosphatase MutT (NUDIX family)
VSSGWLAGYQARGETEAADVARMRELAAAEPDPWSRSLPLHFTASALVLHPDSGRVLLRWHQRLQKWLQAGGHADPGESDPLAIALREAAEETGLPDLVPWPDGGIKHVVVCHVPAGKGEPEHEHADLRYFVATSEPDAARPENPDAPLRWLTLDEARDLVGANNLRHTLERMAELLGLRADGVQVVVRAADEDQAVGSRRGGDERAGVWRGVGPHRITGLGVKCLQCLAGGSVELTPAQRWADFTA